MYKVGDLIIYGSTGVCKVVDITSRSPAGTKQGQLYYVLVPLYQDYTIITPTNNTKIFMRPIITKEEAEKIIDMIPSIKAEAYHNSTLNKLTEHYKGLLNTHDCAELLEMCMSIYAKKEIYEQQKRKFGAVDEKYMKRAEELLFGELAAAIGIEKDQVTDYISERVDLEP